MQDVRLEEMMDKRIIYALSMRIGRPLMLCFLFVPVGMFRGMVQAMGSLHDQTYDQAQIEAGMRFALHSTAFGLTAGIIGALLYFVAQDKLDSLNKPNKVLDATSL
jgi:hypothetical protein